ncbi:MAG TPA: hypothetical protein ENJ10_09205 [Caldithrix abyssi]|uniref:Uncharacterized protein n=1 Tax=Caldithrix abyssi TaxID=187145 RepID=A0A7V1LMP8_CALAY|nr:hypothetical protein [Caldithrix abyssi]
MMPNPLSPHLADDVYQFLVKNKLLRSKGIRDYVIRCRFNEMRHHLPTSVIIERLQDEYPYLQYETIRKIIYQRQEVLEEELADFGI